MTVSDMNSPLYLNKCLPLLDKIGKKSWDSVRKDQFSLGHK